MSTKSEEIIMLEAAVKEAEAVLSKARADLLSARSKEAGIWIGALVKGRGGKEYRVGVVRASWSGKPWVDGYQRLKGGSFGSALRRLYENWEIVPGQTPPEEDGHS